MKLQNIDEYANSSKLVRTNESMKRIVSGEYEYYKLNYEPLQLFTSQYKLKDSDVFIGFNDDAQVAKRSSTLIYHGKSPNEMNLEEVKYIYCGLEDEFYTPADYRKLLKGVYHGTRISIKAIPTNQIDNY